MRERSFARGSADLLRRSLPASSQTSDGSGDSRAAADAFNAALAAATASSPTLFLNDALTQLARLLHVESCTILVAEEPALRSVAAVGLPTTLELPLEEARLDSRYAQEWLAGPSVLEDADSLVAGSPCGGRLVEHGFRSRWSVPLTLVDDRALGVLVAYGRENGRPHEDTLALASAYGSVIALGLDRLHQESSLAARYQAVVVALTSALDARDDYTGRHSSETVALTLAVGRRVGASESELELLSQVAVLHDVGKLGIPTEILMKTGPLDSDEWALMREHPVIGERIIGQIPGLGEVARAIRSEHERWDGRGYPDGLAGEQIPLVSRIVFACDAWHAMTSDRPYRPAMDHASARRELHAGAGTQFDPRVTQALLEILGDHAPPLVCSPRESRDRMLSHELADLAAAIGAPDLFVFRKVADQIYSHFGGVGRGAGWAGNIELHPGQEEHLRVALDRGRATCIQLEQTGRIIGPYYGRSAVIVPCSEDTVVVFGSPTDSVAGACTERSAILAEHARSLVTEVSPAKRLADELEVLAAVRDITTVNVEELPETLAAIARRSRTALSAEYAAVATIPSDEVDAAIGADGEGWEPSDSDAAARALARFGAAPSELPMLCQDLAEITDAPAGFRHEEGVSSLHVLAIGSPAIAVMLVAHAGSGLRGFTDLCQRVASAMSDAAEVVVRRSIAQERLQAENARLATQLRTDTLTGVASRTAWEEALRGQEMHHGRNPAPASIVIVDVDELKIVNDEQGHLAGDALLRRCARMLADSVRATDLVARIGGDEFGVLLRYSDADEAQAWCERLEASLPEPSGDEPPLRVSLGAATVSHTEGVESAVVAADRAMYEMKLRRPPARR
jgi:diguanylate cyclase (GGDEF)-like protein